LSIKKPETKNPEGRNTRKSQLMQKGGKTRGGEGKNYLGMTFQSLADAIENRDKGRRKEGQGAESTRIQIMGSAVGKKGISTGRFGLLLREPQERKRLSGKEERKHQKENKPKSNLLDLTKGKEKRTHKREHVGHP